jgi:hypothetical protein
MTRRQKMKVREFTCVVCGRRDVDLSRSQNKKFCSETCSQEYYRRKRGVGLEKERELCRFNDAVECSKHMCRNCGWNPAVAKKRMEANNG